MTTAFTIAAALLVLFAGIKLLRIWRGERRVAAFVRAFTLHARNAGWIISWVSREHGPVATFHGALGAFPLKGALQWQETGGHWNPTLQLAVEAENAARPNLAVVSPHAGGILAIPGTDRIPIHAETHDRVFDAHFHLRVSRLSDVEYFSRDLRSTFLELWNPRLLAGPGGVQLWCWIPLENDARRALTLQRVTELLERFVALEGPAAGR